MSAHTTAPLSMSSKPPAGGYYAVRVGRSPGVYRSWDECKAVVDGYPSAKFQRFKTATEAEAFASETVSSAAGISLADKTTTTTTAMPISVTPVGPRRNKRPAPYQTISGSRSSNSSSATNIHNNSNNNTSRVTTTTVDTAVGPTRPNLSNLGRTRPPRAAQPTKQSITHPGMKPPAAGILDDGTLVVYTDGASSKNGHKGARAGLGVYFGHSDPRNLAEPLLGAKQTNQRAELSAIIRALEVTPTVPKMCICSDSMYSINCLTVWFRNWERTAWINSQGKPVENDDLVKHALTLIRERSGSVRFVHVRGHSGIEGNEEADRLAVRGALS
ncbi:hypothetical protein LPJ66_005802 [Kickxella alabastrina]|uniref:Uncharacterized protein n=1 Tax=Kickxella alabastrina TaxID=61397 RepID=A0ACC1IFT8_9FUNG|nr:hypothetical protein LPJ66_005802 [Kickxella alabastrina]